MFKKLFDEDWEVFEKIWQMLNFNLQFGKFEKGFFEKMKDYFKQKMMCLCILVFYGFGLGC